MTSSEETGWHNIIKWKGGWTCIGKERKLGEKKGDGVGVIMEKKRQKHDKSIAMQENRKQTGPWKRRLLQ